MPRNLIIGKGNRSSKPKEIENESDTEWFSDEGSESDTEWFSDEESGVPTAPATIINNANPLQAEETQPPIASAAPVLEAQIPETPQAQSRINAWNLITDLKQQIQKLNKKIDNLRTQRFDANILLEDNASWDSDDEADLDEKESRLAELEAQLQNVLNQKHSRVIKFLRR